MEFLLEEVTYQITLPKVLGVKQWEDGALPRHQPRDMLW